MRLSWSYVKVCERVVSRLLVIHRRGQRSCLKRDRCSCKSGQRIAASGEALISLGWRRLLKVSVMLRPVKEED